ncbi:MAG: hypothetical protein J6J36_06775 [Clostridia bacterium]|nr:hypothetical protein [Clostridia bacterium]
MASIKGITIKNIVDFKGHEGESLTQCDVYYKGKKVAFFSQDSWGGEDRLDFDYKLSFEKRQELERLFKEKAQEFLNDRLTKGERVEFYQDHKEMYDVGTMILDLAELKDIEKMYKKILKQGKNCLLAYTKADGWTLGILGWNRDIVKDTELDLMLAQKKIQKNQVKYFIKDLADFEIK